MKKASIVFSVVLMASLLLAACGGSNGTEGTPGALGTPGAFDTPDVGTIPNTGLTPTSDLGVVSTPTTAATVPAVSTATSDAGAAATSTPADVATAAPVVDLSQSPDRLSALLGYDVVSSTGNVIGEVEGVLVNRNKIVSEDVVDDSNDTATGVATATTAAGAATNTPAAGATDSSAAAMSSAQGGAQITYVVVELSSDFGVMGDDTTGAAVVTATPAAGSTPAVPSTTQTVTGLAGDDTGAAMAGDEILVPLAAFEPLMVGETPATGLDDEDPALVLTVDDQTLAGAPIFDRDNLDFMVETWDEQFQAFWTGEGLTIPVTGEVEETAAGFETVLLDDEFAGINVVNTNEEDLGEVEDFILDPATGQFRYAILAAGGFLGLGERLIPVPMEMVHWVVDDDAVEDPADREINDVGEILINIPDDSFEDAPAFDALDEIDTTVADWDNDISAFWQTYIDGN